MVAVGFSPRKSAPPTPRRVATLETALVLSHASLRDATEFPTVPWAEAHGYHHPVAPRRAQAA